MRIWELTPLDTNDRAWEQSDYKGVVFVRAGSEHEAREHATKTYIQAPHLIPGDPTPGQCPWSDPVQVSAQISDNSGYTVEGDLEIVGPEDAVQEINDL